MCLGNIAIGNLHQFLPVILRVAESDPHKKLLSLHALKEVCKLVRCLEAYVDTSLGRHALLAWAARRRGRAALGTPLSILRRCGGQHA